MLTWLIRRAGGRPAFREANEFARFITDSEILAHECGHTAQARRFGPLYPHSSAR